MFWLHKWLGLFSGIVVFIICLTGAVYVFYDDIKLVVYADRYYLTESPSTSSEAMALSVLAAHAQAVLPKGEKVSRVDVYPARNRTWVFRASKTDDSKIGYWQYNVYHKRVYINPYSGKVQFVENSKNEFFQILLALHRNLLLGKKIGHLVIGVTMAIFITLCISGLLLWFPKKWKRKQLKKGLVLDLKVKWKRFNYDLHKVLGFYFLWFGLMFAITGLVFTFPGFKKSYVSFFNTLGSPFETVAAEKLLPNISEHFPDVLDNALYFTLQQHPAADMMSIRLKNKDNAGQDIQVRLQKNKSSVFNWYYFDKTDGQLIRLESSDMQTLGARMGSLNYDLHVGGVGGLPTKILYFFVALIGASLPITGFILWRNKSKKR